MDILTILADAVQEGKLAALCTIVNSTGAVPRHSGSKMLVFSSGQTYGTVGGGEVEKLVYDAALTSLQDGKTRFINYDLVDVEKGDPGICGGSLSVYIEPYLRDPTVLVIGAGHVGKAVVHLASWLGFRVVVSDDREKLCTPDEIPGADQYLAVPIENLTKHIEIGTNTYLVLVTRGVDVDVAGLPLLLETPAPYIGLIGSDRRWQHTQQKLRDAGVSEASVQRIKSPIGLDIHAETPREIALSILSEIILQRNPGRKQHQQDL